MLGRLPTLPTVSPHCRRGRAGAFQSSLGPGRATHAWQAQSEIPDQERYGGLHRACFRDASVHQTWLCRWTSDGITPEEDPTSLKTLNWSQHNGRRSIPGQLSARAAGTVQWVRYSLATLVSCRRTCEQCACFFKALCWEHCHFCSWPSRHGYAERPPVLYIT